jgi:membrane protease YdiL (CAAX protease family)
VTRGGCRIASPRPSAAAGSRIAGPLPLPAPDGYDVSRFVGLVGSLYLFLVARPLDAIGYTYLLRLRELILAGVAFLAFAVVALPLGLATGFLVWQPEPNATKIFLSPVLIYLVTAVPEEFLFRGLIQNLLGRWLGPHPALAVGAVVFGLAHLPDLRYALLAALAGVAFGWVYLRTRKITAAAVTHGLVDLVWGAVLGG